MSKRIALIGLDGSGKSLNIESMKKDKDYLLYDFIWVRWKPTLLKPLYMLMERKISKKNRDFDEEIQTNGVSNDKQKILDVNYKIKTGLKEKLFSNFIIRTMWMVLSIIDYFFQFHIKVFPSILSGKNVIFDRFYLDLFVDQGINFGFSPEKIRREIFRFRFLFPKIDRYIYIRVSPDICYMRKNDIPNMEYLNKRYFIYEYLSKEKNWTVVNGECSFREVNTQIKKEIFRV